MSTTSQSNNVKEVTDYILPTPAVHEEGVKTQHWQLKDMLKFHKERLIFPQSLKVYAYDYKAKTKEAITPQLAFAPASLSINDNFVVVGGNKGQLFVRNRITDDHKYHFISENINNHIYLHENIVYVSNNDRILRILSLENGVTHNIEFVSQVNFSCVSPDGKYLVMVGDTNDVYVYSIENLGYRLIKKLKTEKDGGFSVAWNNLSTKFAVATQDGFVCIWDIRSDEKTHVISSKQQGSHKGAIRNVFFSTKKSLDLLFFTEQASFLTVFDARTFERKHTVKIGHDLQITGSNISESEFKVFVSSETKIYEYDINTVCRRIFDTK